MNQQRRSEPEIQDWSEDLRAEYILLQGIHEDYNKRAFSLKAVATLLPGAGLAVGLSKMDVGVLIATITVSISLWLTEAIWRTLQYHHRRRLAHIEKMFREIRPGNFGPPFQIFHMWGRSWGPYSKWWRPWWRTLKQPFVFLPYLIIIITAVAGLGFAFSGYGATVDPPPNQRIVEWKDRAADATALTVTARLGGVAQADAVESSAPERAEGPTEPPAERTALPVWVPVLSVLVAIVAAIFIALIRYRRPMVAPRDGDGAAGGEGKGSAAVTTASFAAAFTAFVTAFAAVTKVGEPWPLALPFLLTPLSVLAAKRFTSRRIRRLIVSMSVIASIVVACAFLIPASAAGNFRSWPLELGRNFMALIAKLKAGEVAALLAAVLGYLIALFGSALVNSKKAG